MCGSKKSSAPPPPAPAPQVVHHTHAENVADNSNAVRQDSIAASSTTGTSSFGSELGSSAPTPTK